MVLGLVDGLGFEPRSGWLQTSRSPVKLSAQFRTLGSRESAAWVRLIEEIGSGCRIRTGDFQLMRLDFYR